MQEKTSADAMKRFRIFDLFILTFLAVISEVFSTAFLDIVGSAFYLSFATLVITITLFRWGAWAGIPSIAVGIAAMLLAGWDNFGNAALYYVFAQPFMVLPVLFYGKRNRNKIIDNNVFYFLAVIAVHLSLCFGKGLSLLLISGEWGGFADYFASMLFTMVINLLILALLKMRKNLICDMRYYFTGQNDEI